MSTPVSITLVAYGQPVTGIKIPVGSSVDWHISLQDPVTREALNLTNCTVILSLSELKLNGEADLPAKISREATINSPSSAGIVLAQWLSTDTAPTTSTSFAPGNYGLDLWVTDIDGNREQLIAFSVMELTPAVGMPDSDITPLPSQTPFAKGDTGPTGPVGMTWLGVYDNAHAYVANDVVSYDDGDVTSSYICILATTGHIPTNATYWELVSSGLIGSAYDLINDADTVKIGSDTAVGLELGSNSYVTKMMGTVELEAALQMVSSSNAVDLSASDGTFDTTRGVNTFQGSSNVFSSGKIGTDPSNQINIPSANGDVFVTETGTQDLVNKTITAPEIIDATFNGSYALQGTPILVANLNPNNNDTYALGDASHEFTAVATRRIIAGDAATLGHLVKNVSDSEFTLNDAMQSLTNKTLNECALNDPQLAEPQLFGDVTGTYVLSGAPTIGASMSVATDATLTIGTPSTRLGSISVNKIIGGLGNSTGHTVPGAGGDDVFTLNDTAQTLTNKTLVSVAIDGFTISGSVANDFSGSTGDFKTSQGAFTSGSSSNTFTNAITAPSVDADSATLELGTSTATAVDIGKSGIDTTITGNVVTQTGSLTLGANAASSLTTSAGALTITAAATSSWTSADALAIDAATTLDLGASTSNEIEIGNTANTEVITVNTKSDGYIQYTGSSGNDFILGNPTATAPLSTVNSMPLTLRGSYWNGASDVTDEAQLIYKIDSTDPTSHLGVKIDGTERLKLDSTGRLLVTQGASLDVISAGAMNIALSTATSVAIAKSGVTTSVNGLLTVNAGVTASGSTAINLGGNSGAFTTPTGATVLAGSTNTVSSGAIGPNASDQHVILSVASDTFVLENAQQTLTNKVLVTPVADGYEFTPKDVVPDPIGTVGTIWVKSNDSNKLHYTDTHGFDVRVGVANADINWRGVYDSGTTYAPNDGVTFNNGTTVSSYICIQATTGNDPTDATYWALYAQGEGSEYNIKDFGAVGDGVTDDYDAFVTALSTVGSSGLGTLNFPAGIYLINSTLDWTVSDIKWLGHGNVTIKCPLVKLIEFTSTCENVIYENLTFHSSVVLGAPQPWGMFTSFATVGTPFGLNNINFFNCEFTAPTGGNAIKLVSQDNTNVHQNITFLACDFHDLGRMGVEVQNHIADTTNRYKNVVVRQCDFTNLGLIEDPGTGQGVSYTGPGINCVVDACIFSNCQTIAIEYTDGGYGTITNNRFKDFQTRGSGSIAPYSPISLTGGATAYCLPGMTITGNHELENPGATSRNWNFYNLIDSVISGNLTQGGGFNLDGSSRCIITENNVKTFTVEAVNFTGASTRNKIHNNILDTTQNSGAFAVIRFDGAGVTNNAAYLNDLFFDFGVKYDEINGATGNLTFLNFPNDDRGIEITAGDDSLITTTGGNQTIDAAVNVLLGPITASAIGLGNSSAATAITLETTSTGYVQYLGGPSNAVAIGQPTATAILSTVNSPALTLRSSYWNGAASTNNDAQLVHFSDSTSPTSHLAVNIGAGPVASFQSSGNFLIGAGKAFDLLAAGELKVGTTTATSITLGKTGVGTTVAGVLTGSAGMIVSTVGPASDKQHILPVVASDTVALLAATQVFTNKTLTSPVLSTPTISGTVSGTYSLSSPTITSAAISNPVLSGTATGTYTLGGTGTLSAPNITTPTITSPVITGTITGTRTEAGTPTLGANLGVLSTATYSIGDITHLLTAVSVSKLIGGASNTTGHTIPNAADDTIALIAATQVFTNKTLTSATLSTPVFSGNITGTYGLTGTPTITSAAIVSPVLSGTTTGTYTLAGTPTLTSPTISTPIFSGSATGTYTLAGTPTITSPTISTPIFSGTATGTYTLAGTPTITSATLSTPVFSGTATGTYTLGGTVNISSPVLSTPTFSGTVTSDITQVGALTQSGGVVSLTPNAAATITTATGASNTASPAWSITTGTGGAGSGAAAAAAGTITIQTGNSGASDGTGGATAATLLVKGGTGSAATTSGSSQAATAGGLVNCVGGTGGAGSSTVAGANGADFRGDGGVGGAASSGGAGGAGGAGRLRGGTGGAGSATTISGAGGSALIAPGAAGANNGGGGGAGGTCSITPGNGAAASGTSAGGAGGDIRSSNTWTGGAATTSSGGTAGAGGALDLRAGKGGTGAASTNGPGRGGDANIIAGNAGTVTSGFSGANGGDLYLLAGAGSGTGTNGRIFISDSGTSAITLGTTGITTTVTGPIKCNEGFGIAYRTASSTVTVAATDGFVGVSGSGARTVNLPACTACKIGQVVIIQETGGSTGLITVNRGASDTINGATTTTIAVAYGRQILICDGVSAWYADSATI